MPCDGKLWLFATCPNPTIGQNVFELEIHEDDGVDDDHVWSFYIYYDQDDVSCHDPGAITHMRPTLTPSNQCDWTSASATITPVPCDDEISSDSGCLWSTSSSCCSP